MIVTNWVFCLFVDDCSRHNENEEEFLAEHVAV